MLKFVYYIFARQHEDSPLLSVNIHRICYLPRRHTMLFQRSSYVQKVHITLDERLNKVVCWLVGSGHKKYFLRNDVNSTI